MKSNIILLRKIAVALLFIVLACSVLIFIKSGSENGNYAVIKKDGEIIEKISLETDSENFTVDGAENMTFTVSDGKIKVSHSDCPDKICEKTGFIGKSGEMAVCLPNKVTIEIISEKSDRDTDFVIG